MENEEVIAGSDKRAGFRSRNQLLTGIHMEAKPQKDFVSSDRIRNRLARPDTTVKEEKSGEMSRNMESNNQTAV